VVDQQAALYGFGCESRGQAKITFGTGAFALMNTGGTLFRKPEQGLLPTVAWQLHGQGAVYALDGGVFSASAALNWAKSLGLFDDFAQINRFETGAAIDRGLAFVPALTGLGCPHWDTGARGLWLGLSLEHGRMDMVQSVLEGVALRAAQVIRAMDDCLPLSGALPIDGGMSRNAYFNGFLAEVLGREIRPSTFPEQTGFGTLKLAAGFHGHTVPDLPGFGSVHPNRGRADALARFDQACGMSRGW